MCVHKGSCVSACARLIEIQMGSKDRGKSRGPSSASQLYYQSATLRLNYNVQFKIQLKKKTC